MIKLIASDMDGTLLTSNSKLPKKIFKLIEDYNARGVKFAVATGRPYNNLVDFYQEVLDKLIFISDNGCLVIDQGKTIYENVISYEDTVKLLMAIKNINNAYPILCANGYFVIQDNYKQHFQHFEKDSKPGSYKIVPCLIEAAANEKVLKIGILDLNCAETNGIAKLKAFNEDFTIVASGKYWIDIMNKDINKGIAIKKIQEKYGITYEQTMVFGDYLNDLEMMNCAQYSYAMANAHPKIKKAANFKTSSNDDEGVITILEEFISKV